MSRGYAAALASLRAAARLLAEPDLLPEERRCALAAHAAALRILDRTADRRRLSSAAVAVRVAELDRQLADRDPGERREIVCRRLGLSRSSYYRLRESH